MNLAYAAQDYIDAFESEFSAPLDLSVDSDVEHATAALSEMAELRGVAWGAWRVALCLEAQARESARLCLAHGWDPSGDLYDLVAMPGDRQALDDQLGRPSTREEQRALETRIRELIAERAASAA